MNFKKMTICAVSAWAIAASALAHGGATGIVKERMDAMSIMGDGIKQLVPMMQGKTEYSAATVKAVAGEIEKHAGETLVALFPEGSGGGSSVAKSEIWQNWPEFSEIAERLATLSKGMGLAADNGLMAMPKKNAAMMGGSSAMGTAPMMDSLSLEELAEMPVNAVFARVSQTCSACHSKFRTKK